MAKMLRSGANVLLLDEPSATAQFSSAGTPADPGRAPCFGCAPVPGFDPRSCRLTGWRCLRLTWADLYQPIKTCAFIRRQFSQAAAEVRA